MRIRVRVVLVLSGCILSAASAQAESDSGSYVVIPGRSDVPVIVNPYGFDASYTIVEGDFGLNKPAMGNAHIVVGPHVVAVPGPRRYYFPHTDEMPGYGRYEIKPPPSRRGPQPAESYHRSWGTSSDPLPASTDAPYPITVQPYVGPWGPRHDGHDQDRDHDRGRDRAGHHGGRGGGGGRR